MVCWLAEESERIIQVQELMQIVAMLSAFPNINLTYLLYIRKEIVDYEQRNCIHSRTGC